MTQPQREALIDLLNFAILSDAHLSLKEDDSLQSAFDSIGWESTRPRDIHMLNSISRARRACDSEASSQEFIVSRASVFSGEDQDSAIAALKAVLASDGLSAEETAFLDRISAAFRGVK